MKESDILHEVGDFWVCKVDKTYSVYKNGITHASPVASFPLGDSGLSLAKAYCDYKGQR